MASSASASSSPVVTPGLAASRSSASVSATTAPGARDGLDVVLAAGRHDPKRTPVRPGPTRLAPVSPRSSRARRAAAAAPAPAGPRGRAQERHHVALALLPHGRSVFQLDRCSGRWKSPFATTGTRPTAEKRSQRLNSSVRSTTRAVPVGLGGEALGGPHRRALLPRGVGVGGDQCRARRPGLAQRLVEAVLHPDVAVQPDRHGVGRAARVVVVVGQLEARQDEQPVALVGSLGLGRDRLEVGRVASPAWTWPRSPAITWSVTHSTSKPAAPYRSTSSNSSRSPSLSASGRGARRGDRRLDHTFMVAHEHRLSCAQVVQVRCRSGEESLLSELHAGAVGQAPPVQLSFSAICTWLSPSELSLTCSRMSAVMSTVGASRRSTSASA